MNRDSKVDKAQSIDGSDAAMRFASCRLGRRNPNSSIHGARIIHFGLRRWNRVVIRGTCVGDAWHFGDESLRRNEIRNLLGVIGHTQATSPQGLNLGRRGCVRATGHNGSGMSHAAPRRRGYTGDQSNHGL